MYLPLAFSLSFQPRSVLFGHSKVPLFDFMDTGDRTRMQMPPDLFFIMLYPVEFHEQDWCLG